MRVCVCVCACVFNLTSRMVIGTTNWKLYTQTESKHRNYQLL